MSVTKRGRILVVEDEADSGEVLQRLLAHLGIEGVVASHAEAARQILSTQPSFDLILIDLNLPGLDGWGLLRELRDDPLTEAIPMVAMTAYHANTVGVEALAAGFNAYFAKPLETRMFIRELQALLS